MGSHVAVKELESGEQDVEKLILRFCGHLFAEFSTLSQKKYDVSVVSPNTYFAMTPLLAQAATGTLEVRQLQNLMK